MLGSQLGRGLGRLCRLPKAHLAAPTISEAFLRAPSWQQSAPAALGALPRGGHARCSSRLAAAETAEPATEQGSIYDNPAMYDDAFSYRDFAAECAFLQQLYQHHTEQPLKTLLELG